MAKTGRELKAMATETHRAPKDLEWRVMSSLEGDLAVSRSWRKPINLTAAAISRIAAIVIWRLRPKASA
jgi:activator of HSP90 ATPase